METAVIDLRSDTVTRPTGKMRQVMASAEVGDDVFGDDPTVNELERRTAEILGKPAAVYMPSGTMTNQIAIRCQTEPGDEILIAEESHMYYYEGGAAAAMSGVTTRLLTAERGIFTADAVRAVLRPEDVHFPRTKMVCVENTHNRGGGAIWPVETIREVTDAGREAGLKNHLDGARLWNASAATGIPESEYCSMFDSVSVCFSKSLGAPIGSALAGSEELVHRARRFRKQFGGGWRQAGIIAAGALYGLENNRRRLTEDNANIRKLAEAIGDIEAISLNLEEVETNIVYFYVDGMTAEEFCQTLEEFGVLMLPIVPNKVRAVANLGVTSDDIDIVIENVRGLME